MLERCGLDDMRGLYSDVPEELLLKAPYNLPAQKSEKEVRDYFDSLARKNRETGVCFAGGGFYYLTVEGQLGQVHRHGFLRRRGIGADGKRHLPVIIGGVFLCGYICIHQLSELLLPGCFSILL